ncbi:MAG TPA: hypothetical protein VEH51_17230 [Burkholderiales bacterium]|nr:hypothetical protein [Burkholderiales bacterium]
MCKHLARFISLLLVAAFVVFAASAVAGTTDKSQEKVTKEFCKKNPDDPRCKTEK